MTSKTRKSPHLVPSALCAAGAFLLLVAGCGKGGEQAKPVDPTSPESYMNDRPFREKLSADRKARQALFRARGEIVSQMAAMIEAKKRELGTDDLAKVKAALDGDPAWKEVYRQFEEATAKIEASRKATLKTVRERITPKDPVHPQKPISK